MSKRLGEAGKQLKIDIKGCLFTPFLGAGASSLRPEKVCIEVHPWNKVAATLAAIRAQLKSVQSKRFLRSFSREHLRMSRHDLDRYLNIRKTPDVLETLKESKLVDLQVSIVRSVVRLTHYFGTRFAKDAPAVHHLHRSKVKFSTDTFNGSDAIEALVAAADLARELTTQRACESPFLPTKSQFKRSLQIQRIYEKLLALIVSLISEDELRDLEAMKKHQSALAPLPEEMREPGARVRGYLRLDAIQWMSDLLWYTLRYWLPRYPTTAELAFELSLAVRDAPARRAELAQTAQALENEKEDLVKIIGDIFKYCEKAPDHDVTVDSNMLAFHYAIAAVMQHQFDEYLQVRRVAEPADFWGNEGGIVEGALSARREVLLPLIFSTNFDRALESIFTQHDISYHVLFPVVVKRYIPSESESKDDDQKRKRKLPFVEWYLRTYYSREQTERTGKKFKDHWWQEICEEGGSPNCEFIGPLIVKLHGAPREALAEESKARHWIILSEVGYLQALEGSGMLPWVNNQLETPIGRGSDEFRSLWFLGYSISDWNVRLRLYRDCRPGRSQQQTRSTIDRDGDIFRFAILGNLGVSRYLGNLNRLPAMVRRILIDDKIPTSEKANELTSQLSDLLDSQME